MSTQRFDDFEAEEFTENQDTTCDTNPTTKLQRRRKIEELADEKRLREELQDYEDII